MSPLVLQRIWGSESAGAAVDLGWRVGIAARWGGELVPEPIWGSESTGAAADLGQ